MPSAWARNQALPGDLYRYVQVSDQNTILRINGETQTAGDDRGNFTITRNWKQGDRIELEFSMPVRKVLANPKVEEDQGKVALERGPIVYTVEEIDNPDNYDRIVVEEDDAFTVQKEADLLGGVHTLRNEKLKAIPYFVWSNRGVGKMKVWLDFAE